MPARPLPPPPDPQVVERIRWPPHRDAAIRWTHPGETVRVVPSRVEDAELLRTIRRYRSEVPADRQTGWPTFCRRVALPLVRCETPHRPLRSGERVSDGAPSPTAIFAVVLAGEAFGLALQILTGNAAYLLLGPALSVAALLVTGAVRRFGRPRILFDPPGTAARTLALLTLLIGHPLAFPAAAQIARWAGWPQGTTVWIACGLLAPWGVAVWALLRPHVRQMRAFHETAEADAGEEWDALHADPQREPRWLVELRGVGGALPTQSDPDAGSVRVAED